MLEVWKKEGWGEQTNFLNGIRLLVLGESHYSCDFDPEPDFTSRTVQALAIDGRHAFFTNLTQVIAGRPHWEVTQQERIDVWNSVCFCNYVSTIVADRSRVSPTCEMFNSSHNDFCNILSNLNPDCVLVCGFRNWAALLKNDGYAGKHWETPFYHIGGVLAARMRHPSGGFSWRTWHPTVAQLLARKPPAGPDI